MKPLRLLWALGGKWLNPTESMWCTRRTSPPQTSGCVSNVSCTLFGLWGKRSNWSWSASAILKLHLSKNKNHEALGHTNSCFTAIKMESLCLSYDIRCYVLQYIEFTMYWGLSALRFLLIFHLLHVGRLPFLPYTTTDTNLWLKQRALWD